MIEARRSGSEAETAGAIAYKNAIEAGASAQPPRLYRPRRWQMRWPRLKARPNIWAAGPLRSKAARLMFLAAGQVTARPASAY